MLSYDKQLRRKSYVCRQKVDLGLTAPVRYVRRGCSGSIICLPKTGLPPEPACNAYTTFLSITKDRGTIDDTLPGDVIQFDGENGTFCHSIIITSLDGALSPATIRVSAHTNDSLCRPLDTYSYADIRFLHIEGVRYATD